MMDEFERDACLREDYEVQWERWLEIAQMRLTKNYTETGWATIKIDPDVHSVAAAHYAKLKAQGKTFSTEGKVDLYIEGSREFVAYSSFPNAEQIRSAIFSAIAQWVSMPENELKFEYAYGFRIYNHGSILHTHVDRVSSHVLSAVYCLEIEGDADTEPWHMESETDFSGKPVKVDLQPGHLFLYESAKLPHGRPSTFQGERYAALFFHLRPLEWNIDNVDRVYALPPGWNSRDESDTAEIGRAHV